jgi:hypothetical protein
MTNWCRLITTDKGYFGLAPFSAEPGDKVCILYGGAVPFLLRPRGENYLLVGECYVHGIMHGEALEWYDHEKRSQYFEIV